MDERALERLMEQHGAMRVAVLAAFVRNVRRPATATQIAVAADGALAPVAPALVAEVAAAVGVALLPE